MKAVDNQKDDWNANLYDVKHSFVTEYGQNLVELLASKQGEKILDLGCGTGDLAKKISDFGVNVVGIDNSENMITQARNKYPDIKFLVQNALELDFNSEFDAVFSNATLHWVKPPIEALQCIYHSLKAGGRFVAEFGGKGNVQIITDEIIHQIEKEGIKFRKEKFPWFFPSIAEYATLMEEAGFRVTFAQHYDRPTQLDGDKGLMNWISMFGNHLFGDVPEHRISDIIINVENNLKETLYKNGNWVADYKRLRVIGIKK